MKNCILLLSLFLLGNYVSPAKITNPASTFTVSSLSNDSTTYVTLNISITPTGEATITKSSRASAPGDSVFTHFVAYNGSYDTLMLQHDSIDIKMQSSIGNLDLYWFDIELLSQPNVDGAGSIVVWRKGDNCFENQVCLVKFVMSAGAARVTCNHGCPICVLHTLKRSNEYQPVGGGVYLLANSVTVQE